MTVFSRPRAGYRYVDTRHGDTLQKLAARELGDAARWPEIVSYNDLVAPFITDDPAQVRRGVIMSGQPILIPAPSSVEAGLTTPEEAFGRDVALNVRGELLTDGVDFVLASGNANLIQALSGRIRTARGELMFHPTYGCDVRRLIGRVNGPTKGLLTAQLVRGAVILDPRVSRVLASRAEVSGDTIVAEAEVETIAGRSLLSRTALNRERVSSAQAPAPSARLPHGSVGNLPGGSAVVTGEVFRPKGASAALAGQPAEVAGTASVIRKHATAGVLAGSGAVVGTAAHVRVHGTSAALVASGASVGGAAAGQLEHGTAGALPGGTAAVAGTAAKGYAKTETLVESFPGSSLDGKWQQNRQYIGQTYDSGSTITVSGGACVLASTTNDAFDNDARIATVSIFDFTGSRIVSRLAMSHPAAQQGTMYLSHPPQGTNNPTSYVSLGCYEGDLYGIVSNAGSLAVLRVTPYNAANHAWMRMRQDGANIIWETAPDVGGAPGTWGPPDGGTEAWSSPASSVSGWSLAAVRPNWLYRQLAAAAANPSLSVLEINPA